MVSLKQSTLPIIRKLQDERSSKIISYILGDSQPFATKIANDVVPILNKHLNKIGKQKSINLFLYTTGGDMIAPLRIVNLIREYTDNLEVLIPRKAHSAGTLLSLGANKIVMGKAGELSPIDPSTSHPFNPKKADGEKPLEISVEDVNSYFLFAKEQAKLKKETDLMKAFELLVEKLHPLALGNIYRGYRMASILAQKLLSTHIKTNSKEAKDKIDSIVKKLTEDIPVHGYPINRREAKENIGLRVEFASLKIERQLENLFEQYSNHLQLGSSFSPMQILGDKAQAQYTRDGALVESEIGLDTFTFKADITKVISPEGRPIPSINMSAEWKETNYE